MVFCSCNALSVERVVHTKTRDKEFYWKTFVGTLVSMNIFVALLPLFVTETWSFGAANDVCRSWAEEKLMTAFMEDDPGRDFDSAANRALFPVHSYNVASQFVSLFGLLVWFFISPHNNSNAAATGPDIRLGTYYAVQQLGNLLITALSLGSNCTASNTLSDIAFAVNLLSSGGLSVIGTNLLCHRYLYEKARIMIELLNDTNDPAVAWLKILNASFKYEAKSLWLILVGTIAYFVHPPAGKTIAGLGFMFVIIMDLGFSFIVTALFLRPIIKVIRDRDRECRRDSRRVQSEGYKTLLTTKWTTLIGSGLAVISSTALYVNVILFMLLGDYGNPYYANPLLNIFVFGINADSVANDLGMLLASGVFKTVSCEAVFRHFSATVSQRPPSIHPGPVHLQHHGASSVFEHDPGSVGRAFQEMQIAAKAVDCIISGEIDSLEKLRPHAASVVAWLKQSLPKAHDDDALKKRIKLLLGTSRFTCNLAHLELWDDLIGDCKSEALLLGKDMQTYFVGSNLGTVLGKKVIPNISGKFKVCRGGLREVVQCAEDEGVRRQDATIPIAFPQNQVYSQLWSEKCFIHCLRMIAMAINAMFQTLVGEVCINTMGTFTGCTIKGFARMYNKCISRDDHYWENFPRPSLNIDLNRNACTFECPEDLLSFIKGMKQHSMIGSCPVRVKNMFLFDDDQAEKQFFYRTVMINWLFTPNLTYGELAEQAKPLWDRYHDFQSVSGHGDKEPSESWETWQEQIEVAMTFLKSPELKDQQVQFIVETQLLLRPYLLGRQRMHLLYKICRADHPNALYSDFRAITPETRCFDEVQDDALNSMTLYVTETNNINEELNGSTRLWAAAEQGHYKAVREILKHPDVDPNQARGGTQTTPLYIAAHYGNVKVVTALLEHPKVRVNLGKLDTKASPLFAAAQKGREEVTMVLLGASGVDVNLATKNGAFPLSVACVLGHEQVVDCLLETDGININHKLENGATVLTIAGSHGHVKIVESLVVHSQKNGLEISAGVCPMRDQFVTDKEHHEAVLTWATTDFALL